MVTEIEGIIVTGNHKEISEYVARFTKTIELLELGDINEK